MKNIGIEIRNLLIADNGIADRVGARIYPVVAKLDVEMPVIVYRCAEFEVRDRTKFGCANGVATYEIAVMSTNYTDGCELANEVVRVLDGVEFASGRDVTLSGGVESFESDCFVQLLIFNIDTK